MLAALACSRMSAVSLTDVCRLRRRGRPLVPAVRRPTGRRTLPAHPAASTVTAPQDRYRGGRRGLARIAARTRVRLGAITRRPYERSIVHESSLGPRLRRLALSVVFPGWKRWGLRMRAARVDWEDQRRRKVVKKILPKGESTGRPFAVLGAKLASGQGRLASSAHWRSLRTGVQDERRTSCVVASACLYSSWRPPGLVRGIWSTARGSAAEHPFGVLARRPPGGLERSRAPLKPSDHRTPRG